MSLSSKILAVISSFVLLAGAAVPYSSTAAEISFPEISTEDEPVSSEAAAAKMREYLRSRTEQFTVETAKGSYTKEQIAPEMIKKAFEETGIGIEGDYLRFAVKSYKCQIKGNNDKYILTYTVYYYTTAEEEADLTKRLGVIVPSLNLSGMSDYNKIETIYKYVTSHITYSENINDPYAYSAYNAIFNRNAVCQGIAQLMYRMYNDSGISCRVIAGTSHDNSGANNDGNHVWLIVKLDGKYYLIDPTWDLNAKSGSFRFFLKGTDDFEYDTPQLKHIAQSESPLPFPDYNSEEFKKAYPISQYKFPRKKYCLGDIDCNKMIDSVDASLILAEFARRSVHMPSSFTSDQSEFGDVNNDGKVDSVDASTVLAYYAAVSSGADLALADFIKTH